MRQFDIVVPDAADGEFILQQPASVISTYSIPRTSVQNAKVIDGITNPGIYFLLGNGRIYVGQTRNGITRINQHLAAKDFWDRAILFLADRSRFTLNVISGLEKMAIEKVLEARPYEPENKDVPKFEPASYSEKALIDYYFSEIEFIMKFLGVALEERSPEITPHSETTPPCIGSEYQEVQDEPSSPDSVVEPEDDGKEIVDDAHYFYLKGKGFYAKGIYVSDKEFILKAGSTIREHTTPSCQSTVLKVREEAVSNGQLVNNETVIDMIFTSPTASGRFVAGRSIDGPKSWRDDTGMTLKDYCLENN